VDETGPALQFCTRTEVYVGIGGDHVVSAGWEGRSLVMIAWPSSCNGPPAEMRGERADTQLRSRYLPGMTSLNFEAGVSESEASELTTNVQPGTRYRFASPFPIQSASIADVYSNKAGQKRRAV
jgi:hypothetical protein